jgi:hypothetical protein
VFSAAEPSPGFNFNIALHGDRNEELEGTELAAEFGFSSLQKFGQEFLKKLRAKKMPNKLLERVSDKDEITIYASKSEEECEEGCMLAALDRLFGAGTLLILDPLQ